MRDENAIDFIKSQTEQSEGAFTDPTVGILAEVLRVFAARGRALRAERVRREGLQPEAVAVTAEHDQNPQ